MADISKISLYGTPYTIKDSTARTSAATAQTTAGTAKANAEAAQTTANEAKKRCACNFIHGRIRNDSSRKTREINGGSHGFF